MTGLRRGLGLLLAMVLLAWFLLPLLPLALWAGAESWPGASRFPQRWGTDSVTGALDSQAGAALLRSFALATTVAVLATPGGAIAARALALRQVRRPRLVAALLLAPVALPAFAVVMGLNVVLLRLRVPGLIGITLVLVVVALPYTTFLMRAAYASYDHALEDEARTLGASPASVRWRVRLPVLGPALAGAAFLAFLVGWSDYIVTLLLGGGRYVTLPILVASAAAGTGNEPTVAALSVVALLPPVLLLLAAGLLRRRLAPRRSRRRLTRALPSVTPAPRAEGAA
jgi:putative spermidine/putrescine transport system permease protein